MTGIRVPGAQGELVGDGNDSGDQNKRSENARLEYNAIGQFVGPTSLIRFATLTAFFTFNGVVLSKLVDANVGEKLVTLPIIGVVGNFLLTLLELRTANAHRTIIKRGKELEKELSITDGIYTRQKRRSSWPWSHRNVLIASYILALVGWLLVIAYRVGR